MTKLNSQQPLLQSSVLHDPSKNKNNNNNILICWVGAQEPLPITIINVENSYAAYFFENCNSFFSGLFDEQNVYLK